MGPMSWEYPYHDGQAQEDLPDRLVPASLKVATPGYCSADAKPSTTTQTLVAFDSGKGFMDQISDTDVNAHITPVGQVGQGHLGAALFVCPQPGCTVAGGHEFLLTTIEQWAAHWNTFHVAIVPVFNCMLQGCSFKSTAAADSLDVLFRHIKDPHPSIYDGGKWSNLVDLVIRGLHVKPNAQYWPPSDVIGELQRPVTITKPTSTQLTSPIVAARWAVREHFHRAVVTRCRSYNRPQPRESKSGECSFSASKGASKAPSEADAQTLSESADEWTKFCRSADEAALASRKAKSAGQKRDKSGKGSGGPKDSKSSAGTAIKTGSGKGSKRTGKEAGLAEKLSWDSSYKIPKWPAPDTSISSGGPTPC